MNNKFMSAVLCVLVSATALAQGTVDDYRRAFASREKFGSQNIYYSDVSPNWIKGTQRFWYVRNTPEGKVYVAVDADKRERTNLFDHEALAKRLKEATGKNADPKRLSLQRLTVDGKKGRLSFEYAGYRFDYLPSEDKLTDKGAVPAPKPQRHWMERDDEKVAAPAVSPDGKMSAYMKDNNIYVRETATGREWALTQDGTLGNYYSAYITWSPDSRKVAMCKIRPTEKRYVYYVESSPSDQLQPKLHKQEYAKPGDELPFKVPYIIDVTTGKTTVPSTELFCSQYELTAPVWNADSRTVTFEYNQRGHKVYRVLELSAETGKVRTLIEERSDKYVNYPRHFRQDINGGKQSIWMSERDGHEHLYLMDMVKAKPIRQITKGEWYVREVQRVDEQNRLIYFSANGVNKDEDPYLIHYYRIGFDGRGMTCLTPEMGMHKAWFSDDMKHLVDVYSYVTNPPVAVLRDAVTGKVEMQLEKADISRLTAAGWKAPEVFVAKGRDGKTDMWGNIIRPSNFDPSKKYPIIEYIYQGPGDQYVPKTFISHNYWMSSIAELGFIVVMVDGMGTSFRSREFENICYKNLKDAGLPDHIAWIKAAAKKYPYMDIDRVGIFGCSAGGQESTTAVLFHPEFYKAAYSACGCHDNRMDKIWWNELWMGYPVDSSYVESSNVANAHKLTRPLMLVVGELDDNVDPASTMQVVNALVKANKEFELVVIPGAHHTMGEAYGDHKRYDFFVKNLLGKVPPRWEEVEK